MEIQGPSKHLQFLKQRFNLELKVLDKAEGGKRQSHTPLGPIKEYQFVKEDKVIAHHHFIPVENIFHEKLVRGLQLSNAWVDEKYRGFGLLPALVWAGIHALKAEGFKFIYAFPNQNNFQVLCRSCYMQHLGTPDLLILPLKIDNILKKKKWIELHFLTKFLNLTLFYRNRKYRAITKSHYQIKSVSHIPSDIDVLILKNKFLKPVRFVRNYIQLNWRYQHPDYLKIECRNSESQLVGFLISRQDKKEGLIVCGLIDYYLDRNLSNWNEALEDMLKLFFKMNQQADLLALLINPNDQDYSLWTKYGFMRLNTLKYGRSFWMVYKSLDGKQLPSFQDVHLSFYDSLDTY